MVCFGADNYVLKCVLCVFMYQAVLETVARVTSKKNETKEEKYVLLLMKYNGFIVNIVSECVLKEFSS